MVKIKSCLLVDVGGTSTRFMLRTGQKFRLLKKISSDTSRLKTQIQIVLKRLPTTPDHTVVGMRGVWSPTEKKYWANKLRMLGKSLEVISDVELAHRLAFRHGPGIVLIAGTGSIALGRSSSQKWARAGGWGPLLGDEGSGFWMGKEYLKRTNQKLSQTTLMRRWAKNLDDVPNVAKLAGRVLGGKTDVPKVIRREACSHLIKLIVSVKKQLRWQGVAPVALAGGLFSQKSFRQEFLKCLPDGQFRISASELN